MAGFVWAKGLQVPAKALRAFTSALTPSPVGRALGGYSGVTPGTDGSVLAVTSAQWTVQPITGLLDVSAAGDGGTPFLTELKSGAVNAADSSNDRADLLYLRHDDPDETNDNTNPAGVFIGYVAGVASSQPQLPATPARAIPLARVDVKKVNNGAPTISLIAPFTVAAGGILPVRDSTAYPTNPYMGMPIYDLALKKTLLWDGSKFSVPGGDTSWQPITLPNDRSTASVDPAYRIIGNILYLRGDVKAAGNFLAGNSYTVCQLPAAALPAKGLFKAVVSSSGAFGRLGIDATGLVTILVGSAAMNNIQFGDTSYSIN